MRSKYKDLDRNRLKCTWNWKIEFCQPQTSQTGRMDRSDRSLTGKGVGLGFDYYCSGELLDKYDEQYEQHLASLGNK